MFDEHGLRIVVLVLLQMFSTSRVGIVRRFSAIQVLGPTFFRAFYLVADVLSAAIPTSARRANETIFPSTICFLEGIFLVKDVF